MVLVTGASEVVEDPGFVLLSVVAVDGFFVFLVLLTFVVEG